MREEDSNTESTGEIHDGEETPWWRLTVEGSMGKSPAAICQMFDYCYWTPGFLGDRHRCICIPLCEVGDDEWTKLMIRFMALDEVPLL